MQDATRKPHIADRTTTNRDAVHVKPVEIMYGDKYFRDIAWSAAAAARPLSPVYVSSEEHGLRILGLGELRRYRSPQTSPASAMFQSQWSSFLPMPT
jgi:hypothetical protein